MGYRDILGAAYLLGADDDVGDDLDILGDDMDVGEALDILGARPRHRSRTRGLGRGAAVRRLLEARGTVVRTAPPSSARRLMVPVDSVTAIAALTTLTLTIQPVVAFRAELFSIDPTIAPSFGISQVLIGRQSQFAAPGIMPAATFSAGSPLCAIQWDTAQMATPLQITVVNQTNGALRFQATLIGTSVG